MNAIAAGRRRAPGVWRRVFQPLFGIFAAVFTRLHLWVMLMIVLYLGSGITIVGPEEVGIVRRFGRLVNVDTAAGIHTSGIVFALPRPIDEVLHVNVKRIAEVDLETLAAPTDALRASVRTIDPRRVGYALTGDHNIVHAQFKIHYQVADPVAHLLGPRDPERVIVDVSTAEAVRAVGERDVDHVLAEGRSEFVDTVRTRTQARLDAAGLGIGIVSLELTALGPPAPVQAAFTEVQSAVIAAETKKQNARTDRASSLPAAESEAADRLASATAYAVGIRAAAGADATAFGALAAEDRRNPGVVRERLYRDAVAPVVANAGMRQFLPPPAGPRYSGLRIELPPEGSP